MRFAMVSFFTGQEKGQISMKRFQRGLAILFSVGMIGGMMPLPVSAEESVSGNTAQTEGTEQVQENGEAGTEAISDTL